MKATILVVEDEEKLRRVVELQLKGAGFEVEQAASVEEAMRLTDRARRDPDRSAAAGSERPGTVGATAPARLAHAGNRDDGVREHRDGGGSDEGRGGGFSSQAVFARSPDDGGEQGAGAAVAARREPRSCARSSASAMSSTTWWAAARRCARFSGPSNGLRPRERPCCCAARAAWERT